MFLEKYFQRKPMGMKKQKSTNNPTNNFLSS